MIITKNTVWNISSRIAVAEKSLKWMTRTKEERAEGMAKSMAKVFNNDHLLNVSFNDIDLYYESFYACKWHE